MNWIAHPRYTRAQQRLIERFRARVFLFKHLRPIVFLCGAAKSSRREALRDYLRVRHPDLLLFYADYVWEHVKEFERLNALEMENQLAQLADVLIIIVESAGTIAELGAFSVNDELRKKLLPIVEECYEGVPSFLNTGPLRWVEKDSKYGPPIFSRFSPILLSAAVVEERLGRIPDRGRIAGVSLVPDVADRPKHLLFLLADILAVIGPTSLKNCGDVLEQIIGKKPVWSIGSLVALAVQFGLVRSLDIGTDRYYYRVLDDGQLTCFQRKDLYDLPDARAEFLSAIQCIPDARRIMDLAHSL